MSCQNSTAVIILLPSHHSPALLEFILDDLKGHFDLAVAWLYAEYSIAEGYLQSTQNNLQYDSCLTGLLKGAKAKLDTRDRYVVVHHTPCNTRAATYMLISMGSHLCITRGSDCDQGQES